jgi:2-oxoglutarate ferredoxin oxidoreductase subunit beta
MENKIDTQELNLTAKDFQSDQDVRWCPGCGDYSVLAQVTKVFPSLGIKREDYAWVSGIGCSSRFPYYMATYGIHGIHGRATAIASGLKMARPDLSVWVATGDGDLMSIGGNHFIHACRRNIDIKVILFNNRIYGLTKGQYSPTSEQGKKTKSSPYGTVDYPFNPASLALGSEATLVARTIDGETKHMKEMIERVGKHKGLAFLEVLQNCVIFNDGAFDVLKDKNIKKDNIVNVKHGEPLIFGNKLDKGIKLNGFHPVIVDLNDGKHTLDDLWIHDEFDQNPIRAFILAHMTDHPNMPTPIGIFRQSLKPTYDEGLTTQISQAIEKEGKGDIQELLFGRNTWDVK